MKMRLPLKVVSVLLSAVLSCGGMGGITTAETSPSDIAEDNISISMDGNSDAEEGFEDETVPDDAECFKAPITDYDSSLSLISYEMTPEASHIEEEMQRLAEEAALRNVDPIFIISSDMISTGAVNVSGNGFVPEINAQSGEFAFVTYGWGHGVGLSQNGANFYAKYSNWSYRDILFHYYPGTSLMNTGTADSEEVTVAGVSGDVLSQVAGIVYREVGGQMHAEAIKAQAVAVYTYIKYYNNDSHDLKAKANPPQKVIDLCAEVLGEALYYNGNYALAMFYASSGGNTANCYDVFSSDLPYLRSVVSAYDSLYDPYYGNVKYISSSEVKRLIESRYSITLSDNVANWFQPVAGDGGYINKVNIDGQLTVRGDNLRSCLGLKSPKFEIYYAP